MNLSRTTLLIYSLLAIVVILLGMMIRQWQNYDAKLAWWKYGSQKCLAVAEKQDKVIREMMR